MSCKLPQLKQRPKTQNNDGAQMSEKPAAAMSAEEEYRRLQELRSGGTYVPPARLRALLEQINFQKGSEEMQRMEWERTKKQINGLVNKANRSNLKTVVVELFKLNLSRALGLLIRTLMKAQSQALGFTPVYAALVAAINSKLPKVGELLISRLVLQFRKAFKRNNKVLCVSSTAFLGQLCNQQVCHEILILEIIHLLLNNPTDDSVDICCGMLKNVGLYLSEVSSNAASQVFEKLRQILQEGKVEKRTQYMIEVLFQTRRDGYKEFPVVLEQLDLVEEDDQITHKIRLDDKLKAQDTLNVFKYDPDYEAHENEYSVIRHEILGDDDQDEEEYQEGEGDNAEIQEGGEGDEDPTAAHDQQTTMEIKDMTETNLTNFRKTIYLILKGSMSPDEAVHKILKMGVRHEDEDKVVDMIVKACVQEATYSKYYGVTAEKLCGQSRSWADAFNFVFKENYTTVHRLESNPLRNLSKFWGHLLSCDALGWEAFEVIKLTEEDTSSSGRIFLKFVFQEILEEIGLPTLKERLAEDYIQTYIHGIFPIEDSKHLQFSINYFTAIGLGALTDGMRESLNTIQQKRLQEEEQTRGRSLSRSRSSSYSRSRSYSYSRTPSRTRSYSRSRSFSGSRRSYSRSPSRSRSPRRGSRSRSYSRSPRRRSRSASYSRSPPRRNYSESRSRSPDTRQAPSRSYASERSRSPDRATGGGLPDQAAAFRERGGEFIRRGRGGYRGRGRGRQ